MICNRIKGKVYKTVVRKAPPYSSEMVALASRWAAVPERADDPIFVGSDKVDRIKNEYVRRTAQARGIGDPLRGARFAMVWPWAEE